MKEFMLKEKDYFELLKQMKQEGQKDYIENMKIREKFYFNNMFSPKED